MTKESKRISTPSEEKMIEEIADLVIESLKPNYHQNLESFEAYAERVRTRIHLDIAHFRERFRHGYQVLVEELERTKEEGS